MSECLGFCVATTGRRRRSSFSDCWQYVATTAREHASLPLPSPRQALSSLSGLHVASRLSSSRHSPADETACLPPTLLLRRRCRPRASLLCVRGWDKDEFQNSCGRRVYHKPRPLARERPCRRRLAAGHPHLISSAKICDRLYSPGVRTKKAGGGREDAGDFCFLLSAVV